MEFLTILLTLALPLLSPVVASGLTLQYTCPGTQETAVTPPCPLLTAPSQVDYQILLVKVFVSPPSLYACGL